MIASCAIGAHGAPNRAHADTLLAEPRVCNAYFFDTRRVGGSWEHPDEPHATGQLHLGHRDEADLIFFVPQEGETFVLTARGAPFPEASEMLAGLSRFHRMPPVWRRYMRAAASDMNRAEVREHVDPATNRRVTDVFVWIPEEDADAGIPAGAVAGVSRIPSHDDEGWQYNFIFARDCA